jgi:uncharacterized Zn finger protein
MIVYFWGNKCDIKYDGELLSCPMCGGLSKVEIIEEIIEEVEDSIGISLQDGIIIVCQKCGTRTRTIHKGSYEDDALIAIELWNKRM